jgi:hypothetical protein
MLKVEQHQIVIAITITVKTQTQRFTSIITPKYQRNRCILEQVKRYKNPRYTTHRVIDTVSETPARFMLRLYVSQA